MIGYRHFPYCKPKGNICSATRKKLFLKIHHML